MPEPDLKTLLTQPETPTEFVNFLVGHSAIENYNFYHAVEKFRKQCRRANSTEKGAPTQADVRKLAEHICKQYLEPDAPEEVNAEGSLKIRTVSAIVGPKGRAKVTTLEFSDDMKKNDLSSSVAKLNFLGTARNISPPGIGLTSQSADVFTLHRRLSGVPSVEPPHPSSAPSSPSVLDEHVFDEVQRCIFHLLSTSIYPNYMLERAGVPISGPLTISPTGSVGSGKEGSKKTSPRAAITSPPKLPAELQQFIDSCRGGHPGRGKGRGKRTRLRTHVHGHDHTFIIDSVIADEFSLTATTSELDMVLTQQPPKHKGKEREQAQHNADEATISIASTSHSRAGAGEFDVQEVDGAVAATKTRKTSFPGKIINRLRTLRVLKGRVSGSGPSSANQSDSFDGSGSKTLVGKGGVGIASDAERKV